MPAEVKRGLLWFLAVLIIATCTSHVQSISCYFTNTQVYPSEGSGVPAGQPIVFTIILTGSCPSPGIYTVRADILDTTISEIISSNQTTLIGNGPFVVQINDSATVPTEMGNWKVQVNAYILSDGSNVGPPSQLTVGLIVVPYSPPATSQSIIESTSGTRAPIQSASSALPSASQNEVMTGTATVAQQTGVEQPPSSGSAFSLESLTAIIVVVVILGSAGAFMAMKGRLKPSRPTKGKSTPCAKCGAELPLEAKFCDKCGSKQPEP